MSDSPRRIHIQQHGGLGLLWFIGWLFTIGYAKLNFWGGIAGFFVWPYYLGDHIASGMAALPPG